MVITCDDREPRKPQNITKLIAEAGVDAEFERMDVGDYMMFDKDENLSLVTRKAGDLLQSTFSGHFSAELEGCLEMAHSYGPESGKGRQAVGLDPVWERRGPTVPIVKVIVGLF